MHCPEPISTPDQCTQDRASNFTVLPGDGSTASFRKLMCIETKNNTTETVNVPLVSATLSKKKLDFVNSIYIHFIHFPSFCCTDYAPGLFYLHA